MESGCTPSKDILIPVSSSSDVFQNHILAPLQTAYLYEESQQCFRYKSAVLIKNPALEKKYNTFRAKKRDVGYSEGDLQESFGFLLFDDIKKAEALGETGVLTGRSTCTTLGDPSNGAYISMYSDCLDLNRWYHGKSGYIAIIRLTKGRVKAVLENYTQNFTTPTKGFDCHVSEQLSSISANSSSFLAFEKTQYYMYELLDDGSNGMAQSPSAACPYAIVSFSYMDTKAAFVSPQVKSEEKRPVCQYFPWRGQLQMGTHVFEVGLRSTSGALIPAQLPPVLKVDRAISMLDLRQLLPRAVLETCFSGEVSLDGFYCSLCELIPSEVQQTSSLSLLLSEIKKKDVGLNIPLNDGGFLFLLHSSHFLTNIDSDSSAPEVLQGMFVFPDSRVIPNDSTYEERKYNIPSEILQVLPMLNYAEGEVEKTPIPSEKLCEVYVQHMKNYAAVMNPGLPSSTPRNLSISSDQYDVLDAHKHLYTFPQWTDAARQNFKSYLSKPVSFQLPVSKASEILAVGPEEQIQDQDDDVYVCLSSPEEASVNPARIGSEDQLTVDTCISSTGAQVDLTDVPQTFASENLQHGHSSKDIEKLDPTLLIKPGGMQTKDVLTPSIAVDLPAELILGIPFAEQTDTYADLSVIGTDFASKHNDFQLSGVSTSKSQTAGVTSLDSNTVCNEKVFEGPKITNLTKTKCRRHYNRHKHGSKTGVETRSLQTVKMLFEDGNLKSVEEEQAKESSDRQQLSNSSNRPTHWKKVWKQNLLSKNQQFLTASVGLEIAEETKSGPGEQSSENTILKELKAGPLKKKIELWDIKPVMSECGRFLVPYGSVDIADWIKSLMSKPQAGQDDTCPEKMPIDASVNDTVDMESCNALKTTVDEIEVSPSEESETHPTNAIVSHVIPEDSILRQSDDGCGALTSSPECNNTSLKKNAGDTFSLKTDPEKHTDVPSTEKCLTKGEFPLNRLKCVLLRGKRKTGVLVSEERTETAQDTEPCLKKGKVDSHPALEESNDASSCVQETNVGFQEVSQISVDPHFAYILGLTRREASNRRHESDHQDTQQKTDSSERQEQTIIDMQPQIIQKCKLSISQRMTTKTLRKHQSISAECVKEKWWLHFQTPASLASEKLAYKGCIMDNSVRKTDKEKSNGACSPSHALNLLADLALSASHEQLPPEDLSLERKPETNLKKCDLIKDTIAEQEPVLHTLLRQPAATPIQPIGSPPPSHPLEGSELVSWICKEHAYSLPTSSSLLLDLSGTSLQLSPLSGSTRLLRHHHTMHDDGIIILHPTVDQKDRGEDNRGTPENLKKHMMCTRRFRHSRTFVTKDGSLLVTKQWKENYDFSLDGRFTNDSKSRTIIRALHGPWDVSIQDTDEEMRLIFHMLIALFYSRSTARFFHLDSNCASPCSEENESLEEPCGLASDISDAAISKALDLSKKDNSALDQGSAIFDLTLRNSNADIVTADAQGSQKETSVSVEKTEESETLNTLESPVGPHKCHRNVTCLTEMTNEFIDESKGTSIPLQKAGYMEHIDVLSVKGGGTCISVEEETESTSVTIEKHQNAIGHILHEYNNEKTDMKDGGENVSATEMHLVQIQGNNSSKSGMDKGGDSNKISDDVTHTVEHYEITSKDAANWEVKEKPYQGGNAEPSPETSNAGSDSTNKESGTVCNTNLLENATQLSQEGPKALSPEKNENLNKDTDSFGVHQESVIKDYHCGKEDELDQNNSFVSNVESNINLNHQLLPMMCNDPELSTKDCFTDSNHQAPLGENLSQANKKENACLNLQLSTLCANSSAFTLSLAVKQNVIDEHSFSEKAQHIQSEKERLTHEIAVEENSKNDISLADLHDQQSPFCDGPYSIKDQIIDCNSQAPFDEQPSPANDKDACHDLLWRKLCVDGSVLTDEHAISEKAPYTSSDIKPVHSEPVVEENSVCLEDNDTHSQKAVLPFSDESMCSLDCPTAKVSISQTSDRVEMESQNELITNFSLSSDDQDTKSVEVEQDVDSTTLKELLNHQSHSPQCEAIRFEAELAVTKTDIKSGKTSEGLKKFHNLVLIPFIGIDTSGEDLVQPYASYSKGNVEEVQDQKEIFLMTETTSPENILPTELCNASQTALSASKTSLSLLDGSDTNQPLVSGSEPDGQCPTETIEKPYLYDPISWCSSFFSDRETCKYMTQKCLSQCSSLIKNEMSQEQKYKSTVKSDVNPHCSFYGNIEQGTLIVPQSMSKLPSKPSQTNKPCQVQTVDIKKPIYPTDELLETSIWQDSGECLQDFKPNNDQVGHKTISQTNLSYEPCSYSQRPVMAVKPSKSDENKADSLSEDRENSVMSLFSKMSTKTPIVSNTVMPPMLLQTRTQSLRRNYAGLKEGNGEANELSPGSSWLSNVSDTRSNSDKATFLPLHPLRRNEGRDISELKKLPSLNLPMQSSEPPQTSGLTDENQRFTANNLIEKVRKITTENIELDQRDHSDASTSAANYKDDSIIDGSVFHGRPRSLLCKIPNTSRKRCDSFLEQLSKRCLQDDPIQASMEQECLIFSEQMKQLLKESKRALLHQVHSHKEPKVSFASPITLQFSNLEEEDYSVDDMDAPSLVGQKIKVNMSDRKALVNSPEGKNTLLPQKVSQGTDNSMHNAGVSGVATQCVRRYTTMTKGICTVKKVPSQPKHFRMENSYTKTEPSINFALCDEMKREVHEIYWSDLNSVVKTSCKMRYRFFILVTSDDAFFEETKAQLEAEGHTTVLPSEFFMGQDRSSPLLIILRNVDIAEHLCEVPHLLRLKKSLFVQFAGIDEPDDVVNLTHQELLIRGGFIMFDRAALESLSLCNMKQMSELLHELSRRGKWKWMLHYRDSRRLKVKARLSAEANEKKLFLYQCLEDGILEVLPYHECDLMSRDQPDYLTCLIRLQVQNISARYPVLITDSTDSSFGKNGILTMTFTSILTWTTSETFTI